MIKRAERTAFNGCPALNMNRKVTSIMPTRTIPERPFSGKDLSGLKFGRLSVLSIDHFTRVDSSRGCGRWVVSQRQAHWRCQCACGKITVVSANALKEGKTKSCGCFYSDSRQGCNRIHGQSGTPLYKRWAEMVTRCTNPKRGSWRRYGGRGITVCDRWKSFENFKQDMQRGFQAHLMLGRKDNDGDYCKENCRWETPIQQANNTCANKFVSYLGRTQTVAQWCSELGLKPFTIYSRLRAGIPPERVLSRTRLPKRT